MDDGRTERWSLREAAERTSRSVTTLRRYIRSGRLRAAKESGRYGPEYFVVPADLDAAGLDSAPSAPPARSAPDPQEAVPNGLDRLVRDSVPMALFQELQLKHEQLLVQYGMIRAGGLRAMEIQAELDAKRGQAQSLKAEVGRLKERHAAESTELKKRLREAELELEGRRIECDALREKVRALEMLTRNAVTNETIERRFAEVAAQMRRVEQLSSKDGPDH